MWDCRRRAARSAWRSSRSPANRGVGLSTFVSVGNKADVSSNDLLEYWEEDAGDARHPAVPRVVRQPAPLRAAGEADRPHQADRRRQGRTHSRRIARRGQPHRGARRERHRRRCAVPPVRRDPRRHHRRDVRHRRLSRRAAAARRAARRHRHERRRSRHPRGRRLRVGRPDGGAVLRRDARAAGGLLPSPPAPAIPVDMVASAGPDEYRQAIEVALADKDTDALLVIYAPVDVTQAEATVAAIREGHRRRAPRRRVGRSRLLACVMADAGRPQPLATPRRTDPGLRLSGERRPRARQDRRLRRVAIAAARAAVGIRRCLSGRSAGDLSRCGRGAGRRPG